MMTITTDPDIAGGQPIIEGTRISVANILEECMRLEILRVVQRQYPALSLSQIQSAIDYAREWAEGDE